VHLAEEPKAQNIAKPEVQRSETPGSFDDFKTRKNDVFSLKPQTPAWSFGDRSESLSLKK
jgi:hypothetical protein